MSMLHPLSLSAHSSCKCIVNSSSHTHTILNSAHTSSLVTVELPNQHCIFVVFVGIHSDGAGVETGHRRGREEVAAGEAGGESGKRVAGSQVKGGLVGKHRYMSLELIIIKQGSSHF